MNAITQTYLDNRPRLRKVVRSFCRFGGDFDSLSSDADLAFVRAYAKHQPERRWGPWLDCCVRNGLRSELRARRRRWQALTNPVSISETSEDVVPNREDRMGNLLRELGGDARDVVRILLELPFELEKALALSERGTPAKEGVLRRFMHGLGWTAARVADAFGEIREALA